MLRVLFLVGIRLILNILLPHFLKLLLQGSSREDYIAGEGEKIFESKEILLLIKERLQSLFIILIENLMNILR